MKRTAKAPQEPTTESKAVLADGCPYGMTAYHLVTRGIVPLERRDDLRKYLAALKGLNQIFHSDGRRETSTELLAELRQAARRVVTVARRINDENRSLNEWLGPNAMAHVEELLKSAPDRLGQIQSLYTNAQRSVQTNEGAIQDIEQSLDTIERAAAEKRNLLAALSALQRELAE